MLSKQLCLEITLTFKTMSLQDTLSNVGNNGALLEQINSVPKEQTKSKNLSLVHEILSSTNMNLDYYNSASEQSNVLLDTLQKSVGILDQGSAIPLSVYKQNVIEIEKAKTLFTLQTIRGDNPDVLQTGSESYSVVRRSLVGNKPTDNRENFYGTPFPVCQVMNPLQFWLTTNNLGVGIKNNMTVSDNQFRASFYYQETEQVRLEKQQFVVSPMYAEGMERMKNQVDVSQYVSTFARNNTGLYSAWLPLLASDVDLFQDVSDVYEKITLYAQQLMDCNYDNRLDIEFNNFCVKGAEDHARAFENTQQLPWFTDDDQNIIANKVK